MGIETYRNYEHDRKRRNELTNASERLTLPMKNKIIFWRGVDGELYSEHGESMRKVMQDGRAEVIRALPAHPDYAFEVTRRDIELANYEKQKALAHHDMLVEFSTIPDAVRSGQTTINGYNRERLKMIVRIAQANGQKIETWHISLDGSNLIAVAAAAQAIGHTLPVQAGSEAILASPAILRGMHGHAAADIADIIRSTYDASLTEQYGGEWYAGRRPMSLQDGLAFIEEQPDLIEQHMAIMTAIDQRIIDAHQRIELEEMARYDFAAALDDRLMGKKVDSIMDAGDTARSENRNYNGDCPDGLSATNTTSLSGSPTESQLIRAGYMQGKIAGEKIIGILPCVTCPECRKLVDAIMTKTKIICPRTQECGAVVELSSGRKSTINNVTAKNQLPKAARSFAVRDNIALPKQRTPKLPGYTITSTIIVGGIKTRAVHNETGEELSPEMTQRLLKDKYQLAS